MAFDQNKPVANGTLSSADIRNNFQYLKDAISKEHNWSDTDVNAITHKLRNQLFISSGTFTVPSDLTLVFVSGCGGGGGSMRNYNSSFDTASGGGGQACIMVPVPVTPGEVIPITIGAGGIGGTTSNDRKGSDGGVTSFGSYISLLGGGGGMGNTESYNYNNGESWLANGRFVGGYGGGRGDNRVTGAFYPGLNGGCSHSLNIAGGYSGIGSVFGNYGKGGSTPSTWTTNGLSGQPGYLLVCW